jgi:hypothetical protein
LPTATSQSGESLWWLTIAGRARRVGLTVRRVRAVLPRLLPGREARPFPRRRARTAWP